MAEAASPRCSSFADKSANPRQRPTKTARWEPIHRRIKTWRRSRNHKAQAQPLPLPRVEPRERILELRVRRLLLVGFRHRHADFQHDDLVARLRARKTAALQSQLAA